MFEQSLLLDPAATKKTGALAASLTVQTLAVGVILAIPLIFSDRLPTMRPRISIDFMTPPPPSPPIPERPATNATTTRANSGATRVWRVPTQLADLAQVQNVEIVDAPAFSPSSVGVPGGTGLPTMLGQVFPVAIPAAPVIRDPPKPPAKPITVGGDVQAAMLLKKVIPIYPPLARQTRVSGTVRLIGVIAKDGSIQQLQVSSGHPLLVKAALDAVRQWVYRPTLLNGQAVEVIAPIDVNFTLSP